ncbi:30S ribosomal protein S11 [Candidatus Woesebacteria bacterium]|nr:30S ribosomal protein S11 [Candidatus Woesebacteria bacterium]MCD8507621.1 30S ribosomal protein S11 [Candidatus Woesebacteria bacterium]MCD8526793.1 30S ribosomal protein S11 [Candidatus Woesebacteria bacterium]MCD8546461.1 30S ribosomal protein S11 [Candidatus Woesebacteria bacterium]
MAKASKSSPKKAARVVQAGRIYVQATFNNTIVTVTDEKGNVIAWSSTGGAGFKGSRKSTPYAATVTVEEAMDKARALGLRNAELYIKGPGPGRDAALRVIKNSGVSLSVIADVTPLPHNGTKARKMKHG